MILIIKDVLSGKKRRLYPRAKVSVTESLLYSDLFFNSKTINDLRIELSKRSSRVCNYAS